MLRKSEGKMVKKAGFVQQFTGIEYFAFIYLNFNLQLQVFLNIGIHNLIKDIKDIK